MQSQLYFIRTLHKIRRRKKPIIRVISGRKKKRTQQMVTTALSSSEDLLIISKRPSGKILFISKEKNPFSDYDHCNIETKDGREKFYNQIHPKDRDDYVYKYNNNISLKNYQFGFLNKDKKYSRPDGTYVQKRWIILLEKPPASGRQRK